MGFAGKVAVITGGAGGLGQELAKQLWQGGAIVWALDRDEEGLARLADEATKYGGELYCHPVDVTRYEDHQAALNKIVAQSGNIDFWVNNAGLAGISGFLNTSVEDYMKVLRVNLDGVIYGSRVALEQMEQQGKGQIMNVASVAGYVPAPYMSAYVGSKHAVVGFTRAMQAELELKGSPIQMQLCAPGFTDTAIIRRGEESGFPDWLKFAVAKPEDVARAMLRGLDTGRPEIYPTINGQLVRRMFSFMPKTTVKSARLLLTKSWKDALLNRYTELPEEESTQPVQSEPKPENDLNS